jgi:hypothetical protein
MAIDRTKFLPPCQQRVSCSPPNNPCSPVSPYPAQPNTKTRKERKELHIPSPALLAKRAKRKACKASTIPKSRREIFEAHSHAVALYLPVCAPIVAEYCESVQITVYILGLAISNRGSTIRCTLETVISKVVSADQYYLGDQAEIIEYSTNDCRSGTITNMELTVRAFINMKSNLNVLQLTRFYRH